MNFIELFEGTTPKLPGAPQGVKIMTPQQFAAKASDDESTPEDEVAEGFGSDIAGKIMGTAPSTPKYKAGQRVKYETSPHQPDWKDGGSGAGVITDYKNGHYIINGNPVNHFEIKGVVGQGVAEGEDHLSRIRKLSGLEEATALPASTRELKGQELTDYLDRIRGTAKVDKAGNPVKAKDKVSKSGKVTPGAEKYVSGKTKTDRYKLPYMHRSSVIGYYDEAGKKYNVDAIKAAIAQRPKALLKQNEKMKHSNGEFEQFFNIGFAALVGIALDEQTNELIVVNTCPGAGSCKVDCFAMKGGKIQFEGPWLSDARILTFLLNDPEGFKAQLKREIGKEYKDGKKGSKGFEGGWNVTIRWHDAGDFFSPEYMDLAFDIANAFPEVKFYAYTKMAGAALAKKPPNFIINWSEGATTSQEKQVKAQDPNLERTKNSRIVPTELFGDLLDTDAKGNLAKGPSGQWVVVPEKLPELKQRLAQKYGLSVNSILGYDEWDAKTNGGKKETPIRYNVIIAPGEPDITANTPGVLSTLLLRH